VIATSKAGATPFLVEEGKTGYVFRSDDAKSLQEKLEACLKDMDRARSMGERAYRLMQESWNPHTAAERLVAVSDRLLEGERFYFPEGPMSEASVMYEDWYDRRG
jgi:glycosyltransferase involved in cell wall biosynthesis